MPNLLIELGVEELPSPMLDVVYGELEAKGRTLLENYRLEFGKVEAQATPRRIVFFVENLAARQRDQVLEMTGPSQEKAYEADGKPSRALEGFLKGKNASLQDIVLKDTPRGRFVMIQSKESGRPVQQLIPELTQKLFAALNFPKAMRWEPSGFRFPRPIRWLVILLDSKPVSLQLADVRSGTISYGHRFLAPQPFKITNANWNAYRAALKKRHVVLSLEERENFIRKTLQRKFLQKQPDEELVHLTAQLVEEPALFRGSFSKTYLALPAEVLACCMKKNQKIFAAYDAKGKLSGHFIGVMNGKRKGLPKIQADFENVLESRLKDAEFFFREDTKEALEKKVPKLHQIIYLGKLGNMADKTKRLEDLTEKLCASMGRDDLKSDLRRAAHLAKADLLTHLVYEFPELQGIVGREYAREAKEKENVAEAIGTQYLPKNLADDYQDLRKQITAPGAILGIADRLDLLAGAYMDGHEPTGSQDPFALRRAGGSLVKLVRAYGFPLLLEKAIGHAIALYQASGVKFRDPAMNAKKLTDKIKNFLRERVIFEIKAKSGSRDAEILEAVMKAEFENLANVFERYETLTQLFEQEPENFLKAAKVVERTSNILKGSKGEISSAINPALFSEPLERELFSLLESKSGEIRETLQRRDYAKTTLLFGQSFYLPLDKFFKQIMVNVEDTKIKSNRQALMKQIHSLYADHLADLSVLSRIDLE